MKTKEAYFAVVAVLLILAVGSAAVLYEAIIGPARDFRNVVDIGLSQSELIERVGEPNTKLGVGEIIPNWGNSPERNVDRETWIYFVFPESQHRFAVSFDDGKVVNVEHDLN